MGHWPNVLDSFHKTCINYLLALRYCFVILQGEKDSTDFSLNEQKEEEEVETSSSFFFSFIHVCTQTKLPNRNLQQ